MWLSNNNIKNAGDSYLGNMIVKPLRASLASDTVKVSCIIACHVLEYIVHLINRDKRQQRSHKSMMAELGQVCVILLAIAKPTLGAFIFKHSNLRALPANALTCSL